MSDWHWDSKAFLAKPVAHSEAMPGSASYKKRKTDELPDLHGSPAACGGCRARSTIPFGFELKTESVGTMQPLSSSKAQQQVTPVSPVAPVFSCCSCVTNFCHALFCSFKTRTVNLTLQHREIIGATGDAERSHECTCQADGCLSNLMHQSVWHQKSRICDKHMSGIFQKQGKAQQFCQQCGRSHNPDAFDKGRRSCRIQLAKHAARCVAV